MFQVGDAIVILEYGETGHHRFLGSVGEIIECDDWSRAIYPYKVRIMDNCYDSYSETWVKEDEIKLIEE